MHRIVEIAKKFVTRSQSQLTRYQPYVFCYEQKTADIVAACFNDGTRDVEQYRWQVDAATKGKPHWCVTPDVEWVLADAGEVRPGQFYIGVWVSESLANGIWADIVKGEDKVDGYVSGVGPIEDSGFVIVNAHQHANPDELWFYRRQLKTGDTFEYLDEPGQPYLVWDQPDYVKNLPTKWHVSTTETARTKWNVKVKRIPRWDDAGRGPVILPCIDPLEHFTRMSQEKKHGVTGLEALTRLEAAMRSEKVVQKGNRPYAEGLNSDQYAFAMTVWAAKRDGLRAKQKLDDATKARADKLACDNQDELPNMVYVDA